MERYHVNNSKKGLAWFLVGIGGFLFIFGLVLLIRFLLDETRGEFSLTSIILYFFQGITLGALGIINLRSRKYYLEWNEKEIRYYLPGHKGVKLIKISDIEEVEIKLYEIWLNMGDGEKTIDLEQVQFNEIRKIKEKFEEIKKLKESN